MIMLFVCTVEVDDIDKYIKKAEENGGKVIDKKMEVPEVGWMAYFHDTEGNKFGLMQMTDQE